MQIAIGIFVMLFSLIFSAVPFILIVTYVIRVIKKIGSNPDIINSQFGNMKLPVENNNPPILGRGETFRVEKLNAGTQENNEHNHAYVHKVEPINDISVMVDQNSTMSQLNQKREEVARNNYMDDMRSAYLDRNAAKNADMNPGMAYGEKKVICSYCGAENVIKVGEKKTCYFCRQEL